MADIRLYVCTRLIWLSGEPYLFARVWESIRFMPVLSWLPDGCTPLPLLGAIAVYYIYYILLSMICGVLIKEANRFAS